MINFKKISKESFKTAEQHGFYRENPDKDECLLLIISEVVEAAEAYIEQGNITPPTPAENISEPQKYDIINQYKENFVYELADIVIRYASYTNYIKYRFKNVKFVGTSIKEPLCFLTYITRLILSCEYNEKIIFEIDEFCKYHKIDIEKYIELKMWYNTKRTY